MSDLSKKLRKLTEDSVSVNADIFIKSLLPKLEEAAKAGKSSYQFTVEKDISSKVVTVIKSLGLKFKERADDYGHYSILITW